MIRPAVLPLAGGRWEPFIYSIEIEDLVLTGGTLLMQVRATPDTTGTPLVDLTGAAPGSQGLSFSVSGGNSTIVIRINETTMEGLLFPGSGVEGERGDDVVLSYDLQVTLPGTHEKVRYFKGPFKVEAGVTH